MSTTLTKAQGIEHLTDRLLTRRSGPLDVDVLATFGIDSYEYYKPQAEVLYDIFTSTTPQQKFPQHETNLVRINAIHNANVTASFLDRQLGHWYNQSIIGVLS